MLASSSLQSLARSLACALGLGLLVSGAAASVEIRVFSKTATNLVLENGCVYSPHAGPSEARWQLDDAGSQPAAQCAKRVREIQTRSLAEPRYLVGLFR